MSETKDPYAVRIIHLRVAIPHIAEVDTRPMSECVDHLVETLTGDPVFPAKTVTALQNEYLVDGQRVTAEDFENPKPKKKKAEAKTGSDPSDPDPDAAAAVKRLATNVGKDLQGSLKPVETVELPSQETEEVAEPEEDSDYNPSAIPLQFASGVSEETASYLSSQKAARVVQFRLRGLDDDLIAETMRELETFR